MAGARLQKILFSTGLLFCLVTQSLAADTAQCQHAFNQTVIHSLSKLGVKISTQVLTDYANIKRSNTCYFEAWPSDTKAVSALVQFAYQHNIPMRIMGNGHSQNGSTLPQLPEILIRTDHLNSVSFEKQGEVTAGAGIPVDSLNNYIRKNSDFALPVFNANGIGPTLGGYISAGGISYTSIKHGGFWNHVSEITIVIANGDIKHIKSDDSLFPWMFGSMGQLGVITEAKLRLIPATGSPHSKYPLNKNDKITYQHENYLSSSHHPVYWFNLFVNEAQLFEAQEALRRFQGNYPDVLRYIQIYVWPIKQNRFVPPLLYPTVEDFYSTGVWGTAGVGFSKDKLASMEKEFNEIVIKNHYHRYIQAEMADGPAKFANYYGDKTYQAFRKIKLQLDPKFLFNPATVFDK